MEETTSSSDFLLQPRPELTDGVDTGTTHLTLENVDPDTFQAAADTSHEFRGFLGPQEGIAHDFQVPQIGITHDSPQGTLDSQNQKDTHNGLSSQVQSMPLEHNVQRLFDGSNNCESTPSTSKDNNLVNGSDADCSSKKTEVSSKFSVTSSNMLKGVLLRNTFNNVNMEPKLKTSSVFEPDPGPFWYNVQSPMLTDRFVPSKLPEAFSYLPVDGRPEGNETMEQFQEKKIREFIGCDLNDEEFEKLSVICSADHLKTSKELDMPTNIPWTSLQPLDVIAHNNYASHHDNTQLCITQKHKMHIDIASTSSYVKKLKYRGIRMIPLAQQKLEAPPSEPGSEQLVPGKDILYQLRIYRPFIYNINQKSWFYTHNLAPCRHSVLARDAVLSGRTPLHALRDYLVCSNDADARHDVSAKPGIVPGTTAKELFPSGFLFINNIFYVDDRPGCKDLTEKLREWALSRGMGKYERKNMNELMENVPVRLGHPEVYVHQGSCEHLFTVSEIRLVNATDPLDLSHYPCHTSISQNHSVYCTACAEFCAKWIVVGSKRVPFDPAFFCETCLQQYMYVDGKKIEDFNLYSYSGNENILRPQP